MADVSVDVAIIGGGIGGAGLAAALPGKVRACIVEAERQLGFHSTGRSVALYSATYGPAIIRALTAASRGFFWNEADGRLVAPRGALHIASSEQVARLESFGLKPDVAAAAKLIDPNAAIKVCPLLRSEYVAAALWEAEGSDIDVDLLHQLFIRRFKQAGGMVLTEAPVVSLRREGATWRISAGNSVVSAPIIVNAAGGWSDAIAELAGARPMGLESLKRTVVAVPGASGVNTDRCAFTFDADERFYFKAEAGRILVSPADETPVIPHDVQADEYDVAVAIDRLERATILKVQRVINKWAGLRVFAVDRLPVVGFDPLVPGFFWLAGQGGYGIQTAPALSSLASALLLGNADEGVLELLSLQRALSPCRFFAPEGSPAHGSAS